MIKHTRLCLGLLAAAITLTSGGAAQAQCSSSAIGTSRQLEIDAAGGPKFGSVQYQGNDFLKPGEIVLTFDDGPHKQLTSQVLDILSAHCAKATFFMVGQRALAYPAMVREVARRGHTVATHTWSHKNLKSLSANGVETEIELGISAVQRALGKPAAPFFRFPYLSDPARGISYLRDRNTAIFSIDVDSKDFATRSPTVVMRNVTNRLKSRGKGILLFHDIQPSTAGALNTLLSNLKADGYRVVHLVPRGRQTTIAAYDNRLGRDKTQENVVATAPPLRQRAVVAPVWEPRSDPKPQLRASPPPSGALAAAPPPPPVVQQQPSGSPPRARDWRASVFNNQ